ncbi:hypothetical protein LWI28_010141 [Acer negundo]|uniref:DUF7865 domain-containing protein n=1 Tax=Acer negundo TaxID=4023 RepID=A0AAD5J4S2_ACENE|nr:hypothetical protein LWI28_010141 [Acer negundo]
MSTTKTFFSRASTFFWRDLFISSCILETLVTMGGLPLKGSSSTVATAESQPNQGSAITIFCAWEDGSSNKWSFDDALHRRNLCICSCEFQSFFAKGCVLLHVSMAVWRVSFERKLDDLALDWPRQAVGDIALALS